VILLLTLILTTTLGLGGLNLLTPTLPIPHASADAPTDYPWVGVYPPDIVAQYVDNWDAHLNPEHLDDWKRLSREILGPPSAWWERYRAGTPLDRLVYEAAQRIEYWVSPYDDVDPHGIKYRYYLNTRYGAWKTLQLGRGNCCDHAHLMIALCRAAGIPARYRVETTYFPHWGTGGHVCVEVALPEHIQNGKAQEVKWVRMDPTNPNSRCIHLRGTYANLPF
jgi:transglutaminase-like putative cysteine protease